MSNIKVTIDGKALQAELSNLGKELHDDILESVGGLAQAAHGKIVEMANAELKSSRKKYLDNLDEPTQISEGVWLIALNPGALFLEEGLPEDFDMKPGLLKKGKTSKKGYRYRVVPFDYGKPPSQNTGATQMMVDKIRSNLRKEGVPFKKIERDSTGSPRVGKLHTFNWNSPIPGKGNTPQLHGVTIYQTKMKGGQIKRDVVTFRTVTDGPAGAEKWFHPGIEAKKFLDRAADFVDRTWEEKILPDILKRYEGK